MKDQPLVSVLMTAYNREQYIAEAIESVLASSFTDFELIIMDDCSIDKTVEISKRYEVRDERVRVYVNESNLGQFPNRNRSSEFAKGEYIYYADSDDRLFEDGIERIVKVMEENPHCKFGMYCRHIDDIVVKQSREGIYDHFFKKPFLTVGPSGTIMRRKFFQEIGKYPTDFGIPGDMYFNLKACCLSPVVLIPFEFMFYRIHAGQELSDEYDYLYNNYKYMNAALNQLPLMLELDKLKWLHKKNKRRFAVNIFKYFFRSFNIPMTIKAIRLAGFGFKDTLQGIFH